MPEIQLNGKTIATQTGTNEPVLKNNVVMESGFSIPSGVTFPAGHVIQVVQHIADDTAEITSSFSSTFQSFSTAFKKGITPQTTTSKIFVLVSMICGNDDATIHLQLFRDGSAVTNAKGVSSEDRTSSTSAYRYTGSPYDFGVNPISFNFMDSPSISNTSTEIEYEIKATAGPAYSETFYLNRMALDNNVGYAVRPISTITLFEITS